MHLVEKQDIPLGIVWRDILFCGIFTFLLCSMLKESRLITGEHYRPYEEVR
jgi:hypothetical protein